jgi:cysteine-rich repeat protein
MQTVDSLKDFIALSSCGNGEKNFLEQCDDGNIVDTDTCSNTCTTRMACQTEHLSAAPK